MYQLMDETYPTQRALINDSARNLPLISVNWPFLKERVCLLQHSSTLLGKDVVKTWWNCHDKKTKPLRQYLKTSKNLKRKEEKVNTIIAECQEYFQITKDQMPKILVVFSLLIEYFEEKENFLFKVIDVGYIFITFCLIISLKIING